MVTMYTTPTCVYCKKAKEFFTKNNVSFTETNVLEDPEARKMMVEKSGQLGVPVIDVDGEIIIGFNEGRLKELLKI